MDGLLTAECERARTRASLALDCELSELERAQLRAHLAECQACEAFLIGAREVTHELRSAPLPTPSRPLMPRAHRGLRPPVVLAVLLVAAAAVGGAVAGSLRPAASPAAVHFVTPPTLPGTRLPQQTAV